MSGGDPLRLGTLSPWIYAIILAAVLSVGLGACDGPPEAPQPQIEVDEQRENLEESVGKTRSEAKARVEEADEDLPERDAGADSESR